jgi:HK97 family phage portal protein
MGLKEIFFGSETRAEAIEGNWNISSDPPTWIGRNLLTPSGISVSEDDALGFAPWFNAITILSQDVAKTPLHVYKFTDANSEDRQRDRTNPIARLFSRRPNKYMTAFEFKEMIMGHVLMRGNFFAQIIRNGRGGISEFRPMHPSYVKAEWNESAGIIYEYDDPKKKKRFKLRAENVLHIKGPLGDGILGGSIFEYARAALGVGISQERFQGEFYKNGSAPLGVLTHPGTGTEALNDEAVKRIRDGWEEVHAGEGNRHKVAILEEGMQWQQIGITNQDAEFLESRKLSTIQIAQFLNMPPHKLKELSRATFSNIEEQSKDYHESTLLPWFCRIENAMNSVFFKSQDNYFVEFHMDSIQRANLEARFSSYNKAVGGPFMSVNEVRRKENLNTIDGYDEILKPLNMGGEHNKEEEEDEVSEQETVSRKRVLKTIERLFASELKRCLSRSEKVFETSMRKSDPFSYAESQRTKIKEALLDSSTEIIMQAEELGISREKLKAKVEENFNEHFKKQTQERFFNDGNGYTLNSVETDIKLIADELAKTIFDEGENEKRN